MKAKNTTLTIRTDDNFNMMMQELCDTWKLNRTQVIYRLVLGAYHQDTKIGREQIQDTLKQFENLSKQLEKLGESVK